MVHPGGIDELPDRTAYATCSVVLGRAPSAAGGSSSTPHGWWLIEHAVGYVWPGGDQGRLRVAAAAWTDAALGIGNATLYIQDALECTAQTTPEVDDAISACRAMDRHLWDLVAGYRALAGACAEFAGHIDHAHSQVERELASLAEWSAALQVGGGVLALFSAGLSEAAAQIAQTERIAATAAKVSSIIAHLIKMARAVAETISIAGTRVVEISHNLKPLLASRLRVATAEKVGQLPAIGHTAERVAVDGLNSAAATRGPVFVEIGGPKEFDPNVLRGMTTDDLRASVPSGWAQDTSRRGGGEVFTDPANKGRQIRIMPGYPVGARPDPLTEGPYVVVCQNGDIVKIPLFGNPTLR